jgi:hypothetical protein
MVCCYLQLYWYHKPFFPLTRCWLFLFGHLQ